jgi:hypothetical protein
MRRMLKSGLVMSSCLMFMLGFQNCTKKEVHAKKAKVHYVEAAYSP